ncbi:hypothetical protein HaLaN_13850 [Haematococcus lacustris]|uniref:Uncharacterized protein n=1 Tax=Haematococcus lacustris TaxID=44745 RepID=A0A699ZEC2_HAELA|nr:hypothetical protein HaLaN_13850 [Haematococcus lacustris]
MGDKSNMDNIGRIVHVTGHPRHWPHNSLFGSVFDPLHVVLPMLGSVSHNGVASRLGALLSIERGIGGRRQFRAEQPLLSSDRQLAKTFQASTGRSSNPHQPKALPSISAARQSALENSELEAYAAPSSRKTLAQIGARPNLTCAFRSWKTYAHHKARLAILLRTSQANGTNALLHDNTPSSLDTMFSGWLGMALAFSVTCAVHRMQHALRYNAPCLPGKYSRVVSPTAAKAARHGTAGTQQYNRQKIA